MDVPAQMRAVRFTGAGDNGVVRVGHEPVPDPGPGEVLVHVATAGLNRADIAQREGRYPPPRGASEIPGRDLGIRRTSPHRAPAQAHDRHDDHGYRGDREGQPYPSRSDQLQHSGQGIPK